MTLLPNRITYDAPKGEKKVFEKAEKSSFLRSDDCFLFHSVEYKKVKKQFKGEVDFIYLDNECLIGIEVKGGEVKYNSINNLWKFGYETKNDPIKQVSNYIFSFRDDHLQDIFKNKYSKIKDKIAFGYVLAFPDCYKSKDFEGNSSLNFTPDLIYDAHDHSKKNGFEEFIMKAKQYWLEHPSNNHKGVGLSSVQLTKIKDYIRSDWHFPIALNLIVKEEEKKIEQYTDEQIAAVNNFYFENRRGLVLKGGPGTGKTLCGIEIAKRLMLEDKKVLFICYNKNLANYLNYITEASDKIRICNVHKIYDESLRNKAVSFDPESDEDFWTETAPLLYKKHFDETDVEYDFIIVDEAQDLFNEYHLDAIDKMLKNGFGSSNYCFLIDFDEQHIYEGFDEDGRAYFKDFCELYNPVIYPLSTNIRNTQRLLDYAVKPIEHKKVKCKNEGELRPSHRFYNSEKDLIVQIQSLIKDILKSPDISHKYIAVLTMDKETEVKLKSDLHNVSEDIINPRDNEFTVSTIQSYKGLENKFIILLITQSFADKYNKTLFFVAATRATVKLSILLHRDMEIDYTTSLI